jgi:hypothetical protein
VHREKPLTIKLRIRVGAVEIDYEGASEFLTAEMPGLLNAVLDVHLAPGAFQANSESLLGTQVATVQGAKQKASTSTFAAAIGAKRGSDLALAAAAALVLGGKDSFSRAELLTAMQTAKAYYKASFRSNLSNYLSTLVKSRDLLDHGNEMFGLRDEKRLELENRLG